MDRLKPHAGTSIFTPAAAPRRGRPPLPVATAPPPGGGSVETLINPRMCTLIRQTDIDKCANYIAKYIQFTTNHPSLNIW